MSSLGELTEDVWVVIARHMDVETVVILSGKCSKEAGKKPTSHCFANEMHRLTFSFSLPSNRFHQPPTCASRLQKVPWADAHVACQCTRRWEAAWVDQDRQEQSD